VLHDEAFGSDETWALKRDFCGEANSVEVVRKAASMLPEGYDRPMARAVHDRGGWPPDAPIDRSEYELAEWELLTDALVGALGERGVLNVDELRRGIEGMPPEEYERASYYERWLFSVEMILAEKGVLAPGEFEARLGT
jgi:hypothetical protein